jgi:hypothetical protein
MIQRYNPVREKQVLQKQSAKKDGCISEEVHQPSLSSDKFGV